MIATGLLYEELPGFGEPQDEENDQVAIAEYWEDGESGRIMGEIGRNNNSPETGSLPFRGATRGVIIEAIINGAPIPPGRLNPSIPAELELIINRASRKTATSAISTLPIFALTSNTSLQTSKTIHMRPRSFLVGPNWKGALRRKWSEIPGEP
jgi:hypothetical protein